MSEPLLSVPDISTKLGVPPATIYQWRYLGKGPRGIRVGRHLRFRQADLDKWIEEQADPIS